MKHFTRNTLALAVASATLAAPLQAREFDSSTYLTGLFGYEYFDSERQFEYDPNLAIGLGHEFNRRFATEFVFGGADLEDKRGRQEDINAKFYRLDFLYHFRDEIWRPYVVAGAGNYEIQRPSQKNWDETQYNLGLGLKHEISESMDLRVEARGLYGEESDYKDALLNLGVNILFAGLVEPLQDEDGDGVLDDQDRCPGTPYGAKVDTDGCEVVMDEDKDGVKDADDACPGTPAGEKVDIKGCVLVAAAVVAIDTDKDTVMDDKDACPDTPAGAKVDEKGCTLQITETVEMTLHVRFDSGSWTVKDQDLADIEKLVVFMREYPDTNVVVEGHTDDRGNDAFNQQLSEKRANAVRQAAIDRFGADPARISAVGMGESNPIADNSTPAGREHNRRVVGVIKANVTKDAK